MQLRYEHGALSREDSNGAPCGLQDIFALCRQARHRNLGRLRSGRITALPPRLHRQTHGCEGRLATCPRRRPWRPRSAYDRELRRVVSRTGQCLSRGRGIGPRGRRPIQIADTGAITYTVGQPANWTGVFADRPEGDALADEHSGTFVQWTGRTGHLVTTAEYELNWERDDPRTSSPWKAR